MPEADASGIANRNVIPGFRISAIVHESGPKIIYRAVSAAGDEIILKTLRAEYPRKEDAAEIRREFRILSQLRIPGVIRARSLVPYAAGNVAMEMEPFGRSLADIIAERQRTPLPLPIVLPLVIKLARTLGEVHEQDLIHKNVVPRNVLVDLGTGDVRLIDFGICSELSHERQSARLAPRLEGSLPYLAPEQTGRTGRDVDYRADYYSFGVMLFELLTGTLPFTARDPLEWVHRHISQKPPAAHEVNPDVPPSLSAIVSKLMSKSAEDRYQSTYGLISDLERCQEGLGGSGRVARFEPGQADVSRRFQIPQRLYGRDAEMEALLELFEGAAHGATQVCLVSGYPGTGKSALVAELGRSIVRERAYLVEGKLDQFQQSNAYGAFARAFRGLVEQLLGEPQERLDRWRENLRGALGANGQLIVDLVPDLALIVGDQPPVPELPPAEAQNRFQIVFVNFVKALATREHPLVVFMDDLQWSDVPTLNLFARLATARDMGFLLLIGAYRSTAVDPLHPLSLTIDQIRKARGVVELDLGPLDGDAVERLTADTVYTDPASCRSLSHALLDKAQGNPFFIREVLKRLNESGAIRFDAGSGRWTWDMNAVRGALVGDNVVDFMVAGLRRMSERTQDALRFAACIGNTFDLRTLAVIASRTMADAADDLQEALVREMVVPLSESYKFVGADQPDLVSNPLYRFQHDRVQQAAYELIEPARRQAVHLSVGRLMRKDAGAAGLDERLIDIVGHLNAGRDLIADPAERHDLARLNLMAGLEAVRSSAYQSALGFLRVGQQLLGPAPWDADFDLMLALSREVQQCAYLTAAYDEAKAWADTILARARTPLAKAEILSALTRQYSTMGRMRESIGVAFQGLALLGVDLIPEPAREDVAHEIAEVTRNLGDRDVSALIDAPEVTSTEARVAIRILMEVFPAAFLSGSGDLFQYLVLKSVNLSLRHGNSPESAFAYAAYGMLLCGALNDPARGYQYRQAGGRDERTLQRHRAQGADPLRLRDVRPSLEPSLVQHDAMVPQGNRSRVSVGRPALPRLQRTGLRALGSHAGSRDGDRGTAKVPRDRQGLRVPGLVRLRHALPTDAAELPGSHERPVLDERRHVRRDAVRRRHAQPRVHDRHRELPHLQGGDPRTVRRLRGSARACRRAGSPHRVRDVPAAARALLHRRLPHARSARRPPASGGTEDGDGAAASRSEADDALGGQLPGQLRTSAAHDGGGAGAARGPPAGRDAVVRRRRRGCASERVPAGRSGRQRSGGALSPRARIRQGGERLPACRASLVRPVGREAQSGLARGKVQLSVERGPRRKGAGVRRSGRADCVDRPSLARHDQRHEGIADDLRGARARSAVEDDAADRAGEHRRPAGLPGRARGRAARHPGPRGHGTGQTVAGAAARRDARRRSAAAVHDREQRAADRDTARARRRVGGVALRQRSLHREKPAAVRDLRADPEARSIQRRDLHREQPDGRRLHAGARRGRPAARGPGGDLHGEREPVPRGRCG